MPWTGPQFQHHNHGLTPAQSTHAASVANAVLRRTGDEGMAIRVADAREAERRAIGGGMPHMSMPHMTMHLGPPEPRSMTGLTPHLHETSAGRTGIHVSGLPRRDDGGSVGAVSPTPGLQPNVGNANPMLQQYIQRFSQMSPEQLQELVARLGNTSPLSGIAQRVLQQKRVMPPTPTYTQTAQPTPLSPAQPATQQAAGQQTALDQQQGMQGTQQAAKGGATRPRKDTVPILAAGGEFVIAPHHVARLGDGDVEEGHRRLDKFVVETRKRIIDEMRRLKGPVKS